jgi:hypothetical protein
MEVVATVVAVEAVATAAAATRASLRSASFVRVVLSPPPIIKKENFVQYLFGRLQEQL